MTDTVHRPSRARGPSGPGSTPDGDGPGRTADRLVIRWPQARPFVLAGGAAIVLGGLVAAVSRPLALDAGSWTAAYLVLVGGVAQIVLGAGHAWLAGPPPSRRSVPAAATAWNGAVVATIAGTLTQIPVLTTLAGAGLAAVAGALLVGTRSAPPAATRWLPVAHRSVGVLVLASIPVGVALAWIRHG